MSRKTNKNIPELRFLEFIEDLKLMYLGEILDFKNGINADKTKYGRGYKFINVLDIINEAPIYYKTIIGSVNVTEQEFLKNDVHYGDVLFQRSSEIREEAGQSNIYLDKDENATFGGFVIRGRPKVKFNPIYFNYLLKTKSVRKEITDRSGGSTRFNVGQNSLSEVPIFISNSSAEQEKIASFLGAVDMRLNQLRRKRELLQTYKRGVMQKLFSQEIRFKGAIGSSFPEWEERKLSEISEPIKRTLEIEKELPVLSISSGAGFLNQKERFNQVIAGSSLDKYTLIRKNEFSYNRGASKAFPYGCIYLMKEHEEALIPFVYRTFRLTCGVNSFFAQYFLTGLLDRQLRQVISSSARMDGLLNIGEKVFYTLSVPFPHEKEQEKISDFLTTIDRKIEAISRQIDRCYRFKQGLLQKMFV